MHQILLREKLYGAVWGQFVGDAASLGTLANHQRNTKDFTYYGDAALLLLKSLVHQHNFSARDFGTHFVETFASPDYLGPTNQTTHETIENYHLSLEEGHPDLGYEFQGGANTTDADTATRLAPIVAFYLDDPKLFFIIDKATRVTQNNELTVAYMRSYTRILCNLFRGEDLREVFLNEIKPAANDTPLDHHVREKVKQALKLESLDIIEATQLLGKDSHLDQSYPSAIQAVLKHRNSFKSAILDTIRAGGDTAGRAAIVGAWLGAHLGITSIPEEWRKHLVNYTAIQNATEALLEAQRLKG